MVADGLDERSRVCFQSMGTPSSFSKTVLIPVFVKSAIASSVYLIEIRVEDSLIHEPRVILEQHPDHGHIDS